MKPWQNRFYGLILANLCLFRLSNVFQKMGTSLLKKLNQRVILPSLSVIISGNGVLSNLAALVDLSDFDAGFFSKSHEWPRRGRNDRNRPAVRSRDREFIDGSIKSRPYLSNKTWYIAAADRCQCRWKIYERFVWYDRIVLRTQVCDVGQYSLVNSVS